MSNIIYMDAVMNPEILINGVKLYHKNLYETL